MVGVDGVVGLDSGVGVDGVVGLDSGVDIDDVFGVDGVAGIDHDGLGRRRVVRDRLLEDRLLEDRFFVYRFFVNRLFVDRFFADLLFVDRFLVDRFLVGLGHRDRFFARLGNPRRILLDTDDRNLPGQLSHRDRLIVAAASAPSSGYRWCADSPIASQQLRHRDRPGAVI